MCSCVGLSTPASEGSSEPCHPSHRHPGKGGLPVTSINLHYAPSYKFRFLRTNVFVHCTARRLQHCQYHWHWFWCSTSVKVKKLPGWLLQLYTFTSQVPMVLVPVPKWRSYLTSPFSFTKSSPHHWLTHRAEGRSLGSNILIFNELISWSSHGYVGAV